MQFKDLYREKGRKGGSYKDWWRHPILCTPKQKWVRQAAISRGKVGLSGLVSVHLLVDLCPSTSLRTCVQLLADLCPAPCGLVSSSLWTCVQLPVDLCPAPCGLVSSSLWTCVQLPVDLLSEVVVGWFRLSHWQASAGNGDASRPGRVSFSTPILTFIVTSAPVKVNVQQSDA